MPSAATLRIEIEHALEHRFTAALTAATRTIRETASTGIQAVDELLDGGLPGRFHLWLLNNQPMGFYSPAVLIKDAQRHGFHQRDAMFCSDGSHGFILRFLPFHSDG